MIDAAQQKQYMDKWHEIKENIEAQLENMGFDLATKKQAVNTLENVLVSGLFLIGHVFVKWIPGLAKRVANSFQSKDEQEFK